MYHLNLKNIHAPNIHTSEKFSHLIHDERFQAVVVAAVLFAIVAFAVWLGSIGY